MEGKVWPMRGYRFYSGIRRPGVSNDLAHRRVKVLAEQNDKRWTLQAYPVFHRCRLAYTLAKQIKGQKETVKSAATKKVPTLLSA